MVKESTVLLFENVDEERRLFFYGKERERKEKSSFLL